MGKDTTVTTSEVYEQRKARCHSSGCTLRHCSRCESRLRTAAVTLKDQNMELTPSFEPLSTLNARNRIKKREASPDPDPEPDSTDVWCNSRRSKRRAAKKYHAEEHQKFQAARTARQEKHRLKTRAHKKVRRKKRNPNPAPSNHDTDEDSSEDTGIHPRSEHPATKKDIETLCCTMREVRKLPQNSPTFYNRAKHNLRLEKDEDGNVATRVRRTKSSFSKICHRTFHLYAGKEELPPPNRCAIYHMQEDLRKYMRIDGRRCGRNGEPKYSFYQWQRRRENLVIPPNENNKLAKKYLDREENENYEVVAKKNCDIVTKVSGKKTAEDFAKVRLDTCKERKLHAAKTNERRAERYEYETYMRYLYG